MRKPIMNLLRLLTMTKKFNNKLEQIVSLEPSQWHEDAAFRNENKVWLRRSQKVALKILRTLRSKNMSQRDLAVKMGVSAQMVNKWVKGTENFTFETISKLENALEIELMEVVDTENKTSQENPTMAVQVSRAAAKDILWIEKTRGKQIILPVAGNFSYWKSSQTSQVN